MVGGNNVKGLSHQIEMMLLVGRSVKNYNENNHSMMYKTLTCVGFIG